MTHFDVGYTRNTIHKVLNEYRTKHFPNAFETSRLLRIRGGVETFTWTTHPWLIHALLTNASSSSSSSSSSTTDSFAKDLTDAIARDDISWHANAFNIQEEVGHVRHMAFGHGLGHELDERFGKDKKIAASQKDTPGITLGMVSLLAAKGVKMLHVGVNDFSTPPAFPHRSPAWHGNCNVGFYRDGDGGGGGGGGFGNEGSDERVLVLYCSGYSASGWANKEFPVMMTIVPHFDEALVFLMHVDNIGPQSVDEVIEGWDAVRRLFPNAAITASPTAMDDWTNALFRRLQMQEGSASWMTSRSRTSRAAAAAAAALRNKSGKIAIPTVSDIDIGDTWVYGIASDPTKMRQYRSVIRQVEQCLKEGLLDETAPDFKLFYTLLLKIPEHTWGSNGAGCNGNFSNVAWRQRDFVCHIGSQVYNDTLGSYIDQRGYIQLAIDSLDDETHGNAKRRILDAVHLNMPRPMPNNTILKDEYETFNISKVFTYHISDANKIHPVITASIKFDQNGALSLIKLDDRTLCCDPFPVATATPAPPIHHSASFGKLIYRTHSEKELNQFGNNYCLQSCKSGCGRCGFSKCNMTGISSFHTATVTSAWRRKRRTMAKEVNGFDSQHKDEFNFKVTFSKTCHETLAEMYAPPKYAWMKVTINYEKLAREGTFVIHHDVTWYDKPSTRMAESIWFSFGSPLTSAERRVGWKLNKLGKWIDPANVIVNGSSTVHAIWDGVKYTSDDGTEVTILSPDAPLVSSNVDLVPMGHFSHDNTVQHPPNPDNYGNKSSKIMEGQSW
eukprot:CAMPEP_0172491560 /NCGR_PEP_ID=MMETSP1066-20121228/22426_1 /TAXON_ID=671091 /ORGANISM="Coscinodiscus wailesii, Strain CCMP2513" /LENGTH=782 /DNA_ID=CAMNT_0013260685 /DNA_START=427 /DNA_END=2772 /DNA_ORIENTATION=-